MTSWLADDWPTMIACSIGLIVLVYILVRAGSIAHYRTRSEYDRGDWEKPTNKGEH